MGNRYYDGPTNDHFDGKRFFHPGLPDADKSLLDVLRWRLLAKRTPWPALVPFKVGVRPATRVEGLRITAIGHASLLVQVAGCNLLLDPVWAERASPLAWVGPRRRNPPAIAFADLPPIDVVLLSHNHYDHMDLTAIEKLWQSHRPLIYSPLGNDGVVHRSAPGVEVKTGDWWDSIDVANGIRVTIVPSYHWSSRGLADRRMALWGGFVITTPSQMLYFAGDTAYRDGKIFAEIRTRFGAPTVAILPIGAYEPRWFMQTQHCTPEEALRIGEDCGAQQVLGIHWGTFPLTDEPYMEPEERLRAAAEAREPACCRVAAGRCLAGWGGRRELVQALPARAGYA